MQTESFLAAVTSRPAGNGDNRAGMLEVPPLVHLRLLSPGTDLSSKKEMHNLPKIQPQGPKQGRNRCQGTFLDLSSLESQDLTALFHACCSAVDLNCRARTLISSMSSQL